MSEKVDLYVYMNGADDSVPVARTDEVYVDDHFWVNVDYDEKGDLIGVEIIGADHVVQSPRRN